MLTDKEKLKLALEALKACKVMIRGELVEHAVLDTRKPTITLGTFLDRVIQTVEKP